MYMCAYIYICDLTISHVFSEGNAPYVYATR